MRNILRIDRLVPVLCEQLPRPFLAVGPDVKERSNPFGLENEAAAIPVRFDPVIDSVFTQKFFHRERLLQLLGDVNQPGFASIEKAGFLSHRLNSIIRRDKGFAGVNEIFRLSGSL
jgi:hypothetical protein